MTGKKRTHSRVSKGIFTPSSSRNHTWTARSDNYRIIRLFKMSRPIGKPAFTNCLDEHVNHRLRLFCVLQFLHLVYPFATFPIIIGTSTLLRVHPPLLWFVKYYYNLRVLRLLPCTLCPFVRSGLQCFKRFYLTLAYSTTAGSPPDSYRVPSISLSVSPGGFTP